MKKLLYITDIDKLEEIGVYKKIVSQCSVFNKFYETILLYRQNDSLCIENITCKSIKIIDNFFCIEDRISNKFININRLNSYIYNFIKDNELNTLYIRKYNFFNKGLSYIKYAKKNLGCNVICEIPTYPYKKEFLNKRKYLSYIINTYFDYKIEKIVDKIAVVLGEDIELNSNKFMPILNGIDISNIKLKHKSVCQNSIKLIGVAHVALWHGYDRVIEGLKNYYANNEEKVQVYFHIVGDGSELLNLKKLVNKYRLNDYVVFHGNKTGQDIDELFNECDLGVGSLANHRKGLTKDSALKNREYCARGIPFIIASNDDGFNINNIKYILKISQDESPVNINKIIEFYDSIKNDNYSEKMRNYAEKNLTWEAVMKPVIDAINNKSEEY